MENSTEFAKLLAKIESTQTNLTDFYLLVCTILVFAMQAGFSLMEAGLVRSKNVTHVLMESTIDAFIGGTMYWLVGYAFAYGEGNDFIGWNGFALNGVSATRYSFWFFQLIFANTASTITSGSVAERLETPAFFVYSVLFTGVMYPIASRWIWYEDGWLRRKGAFDHSGSGVVHMLGGTCSFVAILILGPRRGKFPKKGEQKVEMSGHSITITAIGGYLLIFGFLGYNMSTPLSLRHDGDGSLITLSTINTLLAGAGGSIGCLLLARFTPFCHKKWSYLEMLNGAIAGLVASCAGCNVMPTWAAWVTGLIGGFVFFVLRVLLNKLEVDDVLDAFPVHFGGGITGMIMAPLLKYDGVLLNGDKASALVLGYNVLAVVVFIAWGAGFTAVLFYTLKLLKKLRVPVEIELRGLDEEACGEHAYPASAWEEEQYFSQQKSQLSQLFETVRQNMADYHHLATPQFMNRNKPLSLAHRTDLRTPQ